MTVRRCVVVARALLGALLVAVSWQASLPLLAAQETKPATRAAPRRRAAPSMPSTTTPLVTEVAAGEIPRPALQAVLASGIGRFLQEVRAEPTLARGRFVGWRVLTLFPGRADVSVRVLKPGDTVTRINGRAIERPEQFKTLWDSLASATELVLDIEREGLPRRLRYTITP